MNAIINARRGGQWRSSEVTMQDTALPRRGSDENNIGSRAVSAGLLAALYGFENYGADFAFVFIAIGLAGLGWWRPRRWWVGWLVVTLLLSLVGYPTWGV